jgi:sigma-E factor negative regulatory protein RseA
MNSNQGIAGSLGEQLSALMDGELAHDQVRFLLRGVETQPDLARRWSNYQLVSATLKRDYIAVALPANFASGVLDRLDAEAIVASNPALRRRGLGALRWVGGGAIAAAVAVVALTTSRPVGDTLGAGKTASLAAVQQARPAPPQPYLPLSQPVNPLPLSTFDANAVMPASYDSVLPGYYAPRGDTLYRAAAAPLRGPYVWYVAPVQTPPMQPAPAATHP